jgi:hypothetical protein
MPEPRPSLTLAERLYLPEILNGVRVTTRHFLRNLTLHTLHLFGIAKDKRAAVTTQYPEERKVYPEGYRGAHRLTVKPDSGADVRLRVTSDTDIDGAATDRAQLKVGMKLNALYQVPQGFNAALGYDVTEMQIAP